MKKYLVPFLCLMVLLGVCLVSQAQEKTTISAIKSEELTPEKSAALIGKMVTVEGYYIDDPVPMLVESMDLYLINTPIPVDRYIIVTGKGIDRLPREKFFGAYVKVVGKIEVSNKPEVKENIKKFGPSYALELICDAQPVIVTWTKSSLVTALPSISKVIIGKVIDISTLFKRDRFAILLSGGADAYNAHIRYWNDLKFMYATLIKNGYSPKEIIVIYKDGQGEDTDMPVNYAATTQNVEKAFKFVKDNLKESGQFFYYSTNHGGGLLVPCFRDWYSWGYTRYGNYGGRIDANNDEHEPGYNERTIDRDLNHDGDRVDVPKIDEKTFLYNDPNDLVDDKLASLMSPIVCKEMIIVMVECFSGGNIYDLGSGRKNRIILSACGETEFSWSRDDLQYDEFSFHFTSALNGATPNGTLVNADTNKDGKVSILEAFIYAQGRDKMSETPQYDDNGDGIPHATGDGSLGASTFLR